MRPKLCLFIFIFLFTFKSSLNGQDYYSNKLMISNDSFFNGAFSGLCNNSRIFTYFIKNGGYFDDNEFLLADTALYYFGKINVVNSFSDNLFSFNDLSDKFIRAATEKSAIGGPTGDSTLVFVTQKSNFKTKKYKIPIEPDFYPLLALPITPYVIAVDSELVAYFNSVPNYPDIDPTKYPFKLQIYDTLCNYKRTIDMGVLDKQFSNCNVTRVNDYYYMSGNYMNYFSYNWDSVGFYQIMFKVDQHGKIVKELSLPYLGSLDAPNFITRTRDNKIIVNTILNDARLHPDHTKDKVTLFCVDTNLVIQWKQEFSALYSLLYLTELKSGDFLITGGFLDKAILIKISKNGNILWEHKYVDKAKLGNSIYYTKGIRALELNSGNIVVSGFITEQNIKSDTLESFVWLFKTDANGCLGSDCGDLVHLDTKEVVQIPQGLGIELSPNPGSGCVNIRIPEGSQQFLPEKYVFFNPAGQEILNVNGNHQILQRIDTDDIPEGAYFIHAVSPNCIYPAVKWIKQ